MRILMYTDRPVALGGIETHIASLAAGLARSGCAVTVAFPRLERAHPFASLPEAGVRLRKGTPDAARAEILSGAYDLVHAHSHGATRTALAARRECGIPLVVTLHGPGQELPCSPEPGLGVICVSEETAAPHRAAFGPSLAVIENGIDLERFRPAPADEESGRRRTGPLRALYLGRVGPAKRAGLYALHQALGSREDVALAYVANWSPSQDARPAVRVEERLRWADLVFSTGRGVREAMAAGAAACVLGVTWDGLVEPENVEELAWYNFSGRARREEPTARRVALVVRDLLYDRGRLRALKAFGVEYARRRFDLDAAVRRTLSFYRAITRGAS